MHYVDLKYVLLAGGRLELFEETANQVYKCRCPFCGDSKKCHRRTRGFFIPDAETYRYYCHNCGASFSLSNYLKEQAFDLFSEFKLEKFGSTMVTRPKAMIELPIPKSAIFDTDPIIKRCTVLTHCKIGPLATVKQYAESRQIPEPFFSRLYAISDVNEISRMIPRYSGIKLPSHPMLVIPFFVNKNDYNYIQCRTADKNNTEFRFITLQVNDGPKLYGEDRIQWHRPVYVLEGPIDAMSIDNGLAVAGSTPSVSYVEERILKIKYPKNNLVMLYDNDYRSNLQIKKRVIRSIDRGYSVVIFDNQFNGIKDINQAITDFEWSYAKINDYIRKRTFSGLRAKLELSFQLK